MLGRADERLLTIVSDLERMRKRQDGGNGLSEGEQETLELAYARLDILNFNINKRG